MYARKDIHSMMFGTVRQWKLLFPCDIRESHYIWGLGPIHTIILEWSNLYRDTWNLESLCAWPRFVEIPHASKSTSSAYLPLYFPLINPSTVPIPKVQHIIVYQTPSRFHIFKTQESPNPTSINDSIQYIRLPRTKQQKINPPPTPFTTRNPLASFLFPLIFFMTSRMAIVA